MKPKKRGCAVIVKLTAAEKKAVDRLCRRFWPSLPEPESRPTAIKIVLRNHWRAALDRD